MSDTITLGSILSILSVGAAVAALLMHGRKVRRENEADARARTDELKAEISKHNDTVEKRLNVLETKAVDFMPRIEIEAKIDHEKANRQGADDALKGRVERHDDTLTKIQVEIGRVSEKHGSLAATMEELKVIVKEQGRETAAKLDKITDSLTQRKAA